MKKTQPNYQLTHELVASGIPQFNFSNLEKENLSFQDYCSLDLYKVCHYPDTFKKVIQSLEDSINRINVSVEYIIGFGKDISPYVSVVAFIRGIPFYDLTNYPDKILAIKSKKIFLLSSYGRSLSIAQEIIAKEAGEVVGELSIIGEKHALVTVKDILDVCLEKGIINQSNYQTMLTSL